MQLHPNILYFPHYLVHQLVIFFLVLGLPLVQLNSNYHLFKQIIIKIMLVAYFLPLLEHFFQLKVHSEGLCVNLMKSGQKIFAEVFVVFVQRFEGQNARNYQEDISVRAFNHFLELVIFFRHRLDSSREV